MIHTRFAQPRAFFYCYDVGETHYISFLDTDVPAPRSHWNVNCRGTDVSQSNGLCRRVHGHVLLSSIPLSPALIVFDDL